MSDRMEAPPRPSRAPVPRGQMPRMQPPGAPRRNRRRWAVAAAVTVGWVVLWTATGSLLGGTLVLLFLAALGVVTVLALRALGVTRDHPWIRQISTRPWRDGQEVLQLALRHLPEVFVVTPSGALMAPTSVELRLNPRDFGSLGERMDIGLVEASAAEVYVEQVAAHEARLAGPGPVEVGLVSDPSVPEGRYQLRQGRPLGAAGFQPAGPSGFQAGPPSGFQAAASSGFQPAPAGAGYVPPEVHAARPDSQVGVFPAGAGIGSGAGSDAGTGTGWPFARDGRTTSAPVADTAIAATVGSSGLVTVAEPARSMIPTLRVITGGRVSETRLSGARAGRGQVDISLPDVPTVSREHARFTYSDGQWWVANLGMNGMTLNGASVAGEQPLHDGDVIRWGTNEQAPGSRVEIG
ncbi:MAG: Inner rane component of cytoplasmic domain [Streptosporangiaceae bacterium]|nr:Inner rane component of cytoplasmic domain [Streptosporangiaceae bacterium]